MDKPHEPRLFSLAAFAREIDATSLDLFTRWHLASDDRDARDAVKRLEGTWKDWPQARRHQLLDTVELIVQAEAAKNAWNPKDLGTHQRYRRLANDAILAARRVKQLIAWFPPPWHEPEHEAIRNLVGLLADYAWSALIETSRYEKDIAHRMASAMLIRFERLEAENPAGRKRVSRDLIGHLVWLAMRKRRGKPFDESTIRRYRRAPTARATKAAPLWKHTWQLMIEIERFVPLVPAEEAPGGVKEKALSFQAVMHAFLRSTRPH